MSLETQKANFYYTNFYFFGTVFGNFDLWYFQNVA